MRAVAASLPRGFASAADRWSAGGAAALAGVGVVLAAGGAGAGQLTMTAAGASAAAAGLGWLFAAGWLEPLLLVTLAVPLPAVVDDDTLRIAAVAPVAAVAVASWALGAGMSSRRVRTGGLPVAALALLAGSFVIAGAFADAVGTAAREVLNLAVLLALLVVAVDVLERSEGARGRLVVALSLVAGVTGALGVLETIGVLPGLFPRTGTVFNRAALGFGQPNELGLFLALAVPLIVSRVAAARGAARLLWLACLGGAALGLVGTFSRASWVAVVLGVGALLLVRAGRAALRIWAGTVVLAVLVDLGSGGALRDTAVRTVGDWIVEQRAALLLAGVLMFLDRPWLGFGPGGFAEQVEQYAPLVPELADIQPTPHNAYVQMAAESGILGLLATVVFMWAVFRVARGSALAARDVRERHLQLALLWSLGVIAIASLATWPLSHGAGEAVVLVLALACTGPSARTTP